MAAFPASKETAFVVQTIVGFAAVLVATSVQGVQTSAAGATLSRAARYAVNTMPPASLPVSIVGQD